MRRFNLTAARLLAVALLALCAGCASEGDPSPQLVVVNDVSGPDGDGSSNVDGSTDSGGDADSAPTQDPCAGQPDGAACDDGNVCTTDKCDPTSGCTHKKNAAPCDDGDACTIGEKCSAGFCADGVAPVCNDSNSCTSDACDPATGCAFVILTGAACNDGNACTTSDQCDDTGTCKGGLVNACNDVNVCTADTCMPNQGCVHAALTGATCDDGSSATTGDQCNVGVCVGSTATCDDKNACTIDSGDPTNGVPCTYEVVTCNDGKVCTTDTCNPTSGCTYKNNAAPCDDGDACTVGEKCSAGFCAGGVAPVCNDQNPCTSDACDPATGCVFVSLAGAACTDGNVCTTSDQCNAAGTCKGGPSQSCDDVNVCTTDTCDPVAGCLYAPLSGGTCDDGDAGTVNDECLNGKCIGLSIACDDGNVCTVDGGNAGACTHSQKLCDDKNPCTTDTCSPATGCVTTPNTAACDDGNKCTNGDVCANGSCSGSAVTCNDGNPCTTDACAPATGACNFSVIPGCGVGEICGNGVDDDGDAKVDCSDKEECGPEKLGPTFCFDAALDGAEIIVYAADKPGVEQKAPVPTAGKCFQFYCGEAPFTVTVSNTVNQGGKLEAWAIGLTGVTPQEKAASATTYWAFSVTESGFPAGPLLPQLYYQSEFGYAFTITWPYK